jgi:hypothetical protein
VAFKRWQDHPLNTDLAPTHLSALATVGEGCEGGRVISASANDQSLGHLDAVAQILKQWWSVRLVGSCLWDRDRPSASGVTKAGDSILSRARMVGVRPKRKKRRLGDRGARHARNRELEDQIAAMALAR